MMKSGRESENTSRKMTTKTQPYKKSIGCSKSSSKREVHSDIGLPPETNKISKDQPNQPPKIRGVGRESKTQSQQKEENYKCKINK